MTNHEKYMSRCLELAGLGASDAAPNPMVGCVIVCRGKIIGEGWHRRYGGAHAEVNAVSAVKTPELLAESTLYVSLEPCAHFGKTPPCSDLIIEKKIPTVVIGTVDPFAEVAGKGIEKLRRAGVQVDVGILEAECREINRRFFTFHEKKRPYILLKWAQTTDGFMDIARMPDDYGQPTWITNELSRRLVHQTRTREAAILVGTNTALKDNPSLTAREWSGPQPLRLVTDRTLRLPPNLHLFDGAVPTLVFTEKQQAAAGNAEWVSIDFQKNIPGQILAELFRRGIQSVMVEGGPQLLESFIGQNLWDEAHIYTGNTLFFNGVAAPKIQGEPVSQEQLDDCRLHVLRNPLAARQPS